MEGVVSLSASPISSSLESVISKRTCAQELYREFISYLCVYLDYTYYIYILEDAYGC